MDLKVAHQLSSNHRVAIESSSKCACFYCEGSFPPSEIAEWIDTGQTAICPKCGIDAVLGDSQPLDLTPEFLAEMNVAWF